MRLTTFRNVHATTAIAEDLSWQEFAARCLAPQSYATKQACPLIKLATFGDQRTDKGSLRHDGNIISISGIEGDVDSGGISPQYAQMLLSVAGIQAVVITTASHTSEAARYRVLCPLSANHAPNAHGELVARLNSVLGGILAQESFTCSQSYYFGRIEGVPFAAYESAGQCIDLVAGLVPMYPANVSATRPVSLSPQLPRLEATPENIADLRSALSVISADERGDWIAVGEALFGLGEDGYTLWTEWAAKSAKHQPAADLPTWGSFTGAKTNFPSIFARAQKMGWSNPRSGAIDTAKIFAQSDLTAPDGFRPTWSPLLDARDGTTDTRPLTELGNAWRLYDAHGKNLKYIFDSQKWIVWEDGTWAHGGVSSVRSLAAQLPAAIYNEGAKHLDESEHYAKWSRKSQASYVVNSAVTLLSDFQELRISTSTLDANPLIAGFDQGRQLIDLANGSIRPATPSDYVTKALGVGTIGDASKAVRWIQFINEVFEGDLELIDWMHRFCGYMLTGETKEDIFLFLYGGGSNGKSRFIEILNHIMGDYGCPVEFETISEKHQGGPELAALIGARMALCSETEENVAFAEGLIKSLVSGDPMSVRPIYSKSIQFKPVLKLVLAGNYKPVIRGTDHGIWRRVRLIPFNRKFGPDDKDVNLAIKLRAEAPHILAWMVAGYLEYRRRGLSDTPDSIRDASDSYQKDQDITGRWLDECTTARAQAETPSSCLYANYKTWCLQNGFRFASSSVFGRRMSDHGYLMRQSHGNRIWCGLSLSGTGAGLTNPFFIVGGGGEK